MKSLLAVLSLAALGGCVTPVGPTVYASPAAAPVDPYQWHVVSVEPVWPGAAPAPATVTYAPSVEYSSGPVYYSTQPVYVPQPVYAPAPRYYYDPYLPVITFGLGVVLGNSWHGGGWHGGGYGRWRR